MLDRCSLEDGMRRQLTVAVLLGIAPIICFAQQSSHKLADYAGTWQANFEGTQFMTIKLVEKDGHMTGSVSFGDINVDLNGDVIRAEAPESESPIVSSRLLPFGGLELTSRGEDPDDTITVALKLIDAKTGSVRFKAVPGDTLVIKPIAVHKNRAQTVP
jgi:hypothetical protein